METTSHIDSPRINTVGWIYSQADYCQMFDLQKNELSQSILDYPGGISSFNAEMFALGNQVTSADSLYKLSPEEMTQWADEIFLQSEKFLRDHLERLRIKSEDEVSHILNMWKKNQMLFLHDYAKGKTQRRYLYSDLPQLPFGAQSFELALCSDLLFHNEAREGHSAQELISEMCRVAHEVRVFPLLDEKGQIADNLGEVMATLHQQNFGVEIRQVEYHELKGGNAMLRIWAKECSV